MTTRNILAERVFASRGRTIAAELTRDHVDDLLYELDEVLDLEPMGDRVDIQFALGAACTTVARTTEHLAVALQLPYRATGAWADFLSSVAERAAARNQWDLVYDAADLLKPLTRTVGTSWSPRSAANRAIWVEAGSPSSCSTTRRGGTGAGSAAPKQPKSRRIRPGTNPAGIPKQVWAP